MESIKYALGENSLLRENSPGSDQTAGSEEDPSGEDAPSERDEEKPFLENPMSLLYITVLLPPVIGLYFIVAGTRGLIRHSACSGTAARRNAETHSSSFEYRELHAGAVAEVDANELDAL